MDFAMDELCALGGDDHAAWKGPGGAGAIKKPAAAVTTAADKKKPSGQSGGTGENWTTQMKKKGPAAGPKHCEDSDSDEGSMHTPPKQIKDVPFKLGTDFSGLGTVKLARDYAGFNVELKFMGEKNE
eukprot:422075-Pyramimonas_sp.AAC.1